MMQISLTLKSDYPELKIPLTSGIDNYTNAIWQILTILVSVGGFFSRGGLRRRRRDGLHLFLLGEDFVAMLLVCLDLHVARVGDLLMDFGHEALDLLLCGRV